MTVVQYKTNFSINQLLSPFPLSTHSRHGDGRKKDDRCTSQATWSCKSTFRRLVLRNDFKLKYIFFKSKRRVLSTKMAF